MISAAEKIQFFLKADFVNFRAGEVLQRRGHLAHVVVDQLLGAKARLFVQDGAAHAAQVAVNAFVEAEQQTTVILLGPECPELVQPGANGYVIVVSRRFNKSPAVCTRFGVVGNRGLFPFFVTGSGIHRFLIFFVHCGDAVSAKSFARSMMKAWIAVASSALSTSANETMPLSPYSPPSTMPIHSWCFSAFI